MFHINLNCCVISSVKERDVITFAIIIGMYKDKYTISMKNKTNIKLYNKHG